MKTKFWTAVLAGLFAAVVLIGCGGSNSNDENNNGTGGGGGGNEPDTVAETPTQGCVGSLAGGDTLISSSTSNCPGCSVENESLAIDADESTFANVQFGVGGEVTVRATAQDGVVFPAGSDAGAILTIQPGLQTSESYYFNTYLDGEQQQTTQGGTNNIASPTILGGEGGPAQYTFETSKPFDAVEVYIQRTGTVDQAAFRIHEFCSQR